MTRKNNSDEPVVIKKYANRRLYNTGSSTYVTLEDLCKMVKDGVDFVVYDAKTGDNITRSVLTQIIVEQEAKGVSLLPVNFLRRIISYYDDGIREVIPHYLEGSLDAFAKNQEEIRSYFEKTMGMQKEMHKDMQKQMENFFPFEQMEEVGRQNMELFQKTLTMFNPFFAADEGKEEEGKK